MPQLDFFSISNQFFWGIFYFLLFYVIIELYVVPTLFASIFAREHFTKGGAIDSFDAVYYSFIAFSIFLNIWVNLQALTQILCRSWMAFLLIFFLFLTS